MSRVLLAGESWSSTTVHTKGYDSFVTSTYAEGGGEFIAALRSAGHEVVYLPNHVASERFPYTRAELASYDLVVLSDIGANTLLLPARTFLAGERSPANRLKELREWVREGGCLMMVGGYLSFQGLEAKANYANTHLADVLPVTMEAGDDREETPEGVIPTVVDPAHPVVDGIPNEWPALLGYQRVVAKPGSTVVAAVGAHPLLVVGDYGKGRTMAFTSDMGPHWLPQTFVEWPGYAQLWRQATDYLCSRRIGGSAALAGEAGGR